MSDEGNQNGHGQDAQLGTTAVMPQASGGSPPGPPADPPTKGGTPSWAKWVIGLLVAIMILGAFGLLAVRRERLRMRDELSAVATSTVGSGEETMSEPAGDVQAEPAAEGDGGGVVDESPGEDGGDGADNDMSLDQDAVDDAGSEDADPAAEYRTLIRLRGTRAFRSPALFLRRGTIRISIDVLKTTDDPIAAWYEGALRSDVWWNSAHATEGDSSSVELPISAPHDYYFGTNCQPGQDYIMTVEWKP